jgi:SNF2 family DNA or RNA helicase
MEQLGSQDGSGAPIENHPGELWSLIHFLNPQLLGSAQRS